MPQADERATMDEETRAAFEQMMRLMNDQHERVLEQITALRRDFQNTKGFLIEDSLVLGRRVSNAEDRLDRLDRRQN
jgi:hypothetical protein